MAIRQLSLTDFRNLKSTTLDFDKRINLVCGANGSGKTSLLEAVYVLCQAQSFRTHQLKQCINHERSGFLLFGRFDGFRAGLSRTDRKIDIRVDGDNVNRRSDLVRLSPVNVVNSDSFVIVDGAPARRRSFLDWCLFHVEPSYVEYWRSFQHALKQRNRLLKTRTDLELIAYWDRHLLEPSIELSRMRAAYSRKLGEIVTSRFADLLEGLDIDIGYRQGWEQGETLERQLAAHRKRDIRAGFTGVGIHRDDIELTSRGRKAAETLSRGQSKRVCIALLLATLVVVNEDAGKPVILLIDDLHSELDQESQSVVYRQLAEMELQLIISNIDDAIPVGLQAKEVKMFHVKHGTIRPRNLG
jgi:DNA replication and repair protein RecF